MPKKSPLPAYSAFKQFKVRSLFPKDSKERIPATTIWKENGAVIMVVRRMGWLLCREEAQKLLSLKPKLKDAGLESVKFAAVVHENLPGQLESFQRYWNDNDVYIDEDQSFYKALGNRWLGLFAGMLTRQVWKNIDRYISYIEIATWFFKKISQSNAKSQEVRVNSYLLIRDKDFYFFQSKEGRIQRKSQRRRSSIRWSHSDGAWRAGSYCCLHWRRLGWSCGSWCRNESCAQHEGSHKELANRIPSDFQNSNDVISREIDVLL